MTTTLIASKECRTLLERVTFVIRAERLRTNQRFDADVSFSYPNLIYFNECLLQLQSWRRAGLVLSCTQRSNKCILFLMFLMVVWPLILALANFPISSSHLLSFLHMACGSRMMAHKKTEGEPVFHKDPYARTVPKPSFYAMLMLDILFPKPASQWKRSLANKWIRDFGLLFSVKICNPKCQGFYLILLPLMYSVAT